MISDFVKGKKKFDYPYFIQQGIMLHRLIDTVTDQHPAAIEARQVFRPYYRLYSGALIDVLFDHFLATDPDIFTNESLLKFSNDTYRILDQNTRFFPAMFARMYPYMKDQNWLYNYHTKRGIEKSLGGVVRRAAYLSESATAYQLFEEHYQLLNECYRLCWKDIKPYIYQQLQLITGKQE
jgi:acyl carrier protein phosphodiesterase